MSLLQVTDLAVAIGGRPLVHGVSLTIDRGERLGLIGESGSGKSLTCLALLGLLPRGSRVTGSISLHGRELTGVDERAMAQSRGTEIGMVFQEPLSALDPLQTIGRQLVSPLRAHRLVRRGEWRTRAVELAAEVGLPEPEGIVERYPHELSGGQRQRVVIAMAMAARPSLVVADEPTTALDVTVQARILALLEERCAALGSSLLLVTHDMAVAMLTCDRILVMRHGRVVEEGRPADLIAAPHHPYTATLVEAAYATSWQPGEAVAT